MTLHRRSAVAREVIDCVTPLKCTVMLIQLNDVYGSFPASSPAKPAKGKKAKKEASPAKPSKKKKKGKAAKVKAEVKVVEKKGRGRPRSRSTPAAEEKPARGRKAAAVSGGRKRRR